jgi:hypothetical protein
MNGRSTRRIEIDRFADADASEAAVGQTQDPWSLESPARLLTNWTPRPAPGPASERSAAANREDTVDTITVGSVDTSALQPVAPSRPVLGKRGFVPSYQWEGVVEEVSDATFRARLVPFEDGRPDLKRIEYADFDYDDLADEGEYERLVEGAVFYWTVGKSRNAAGTIMNTSLVRLRRLAALTPSQIDQARREARELLQALGGER